MVVYWMMCQYMCGLLNDDTLIKTKWYLEIKTKCIPMVVYWNMIFWLNKCVNSGLLNDVNGGLLNDD